MTGLEAILAQIEQDAQTQAEELLSAAKADAQKTLDAAKEEADRQGKAILEEAQHRADALRERAEASALLEKRDQILRCKQQLIRETVSHVCHSLENAPAEEYFPLLLELVGRTALPGEGVLYLNARDLTRLPQGFEQALEQVAPDGTISLSPTPRDLESGFVLAYGPIEMDCTFRSLFQEAYEQLRDALSCVLFAQR